jgi:hypothetical protein
MENLRIRVGGSLNSKFTEFTERKKISKQDTIDALLGWFLRQDSLLQSMIVGQIEPEDQAAIAKMVLTKLATTRPVRGTVGKREVISRTERVPDR